MNNDERLLQQQKIIDRETLLTNRELLNKVINMSKIQWTFLPVDEYELLLWEYEYLKMRLDDKLIGIGWLIREDR